MLKRQRPVSPPQSTLDIPLVDFRPVDSTKRQRILPPTLNGEARGWGSGWAEDPDDEDADEEEVDESSGIANGYDESISTVVTEEYKLTNSLLHDLHQHRSTSGQSSHPNQSHRPRVPLPRSSAHRKPMITPPDAPRSDPFRDKSCVEPGLVVPPIQNVADMESYEVERVRQRYEGSNKYVKYAPGSLLCY